MDSLCIFPDPAPDLGQQGFELVQVSGIGMVEFQRRGPGFVRALGAALMIGGFSPMAIAEVQAPVPSPFVQSLSAAFGG